MQPDSKDAKVDREAALKLIKKREMFNASHSISNNSGSRFSVGDKIM